ncbi:hypothetical protein TeGR_g2135 [Tetraparma gracilis]|uniref:J domain-containing protein n=1 Tax=Tetraparma gracilis TaxID=2962635 RepID=A0ABQ6MQ84_9STRA|nr:hypothetical protein TeGR_g2135 [Tetraparma gracilis]
MLGPLRSPSRLLTPLLSRFLSSYSALLQLPPSATISDVKSQFRALAKEHHPDLVGPGHEAEMAALLSAYHDALEDLGGDTQGGGSKICTDAEIFTVQEMHAMDGFDVRVFTIALDEAAALGAGEQPSPNSASPPPPPPLPPPPLASDESGALASSIPSLGVVPASLYDSVSDLKRDLQSLHSSSLDLENRPLDRDGLFEGWEVVHGGRALSYHLFLEDYEVGHGDEMHVVVERGGRSRMKEAEEKEYRRRLRLKKEAAMGKAASRR